MILDLTGQRFSRLTVISKVKGRPGIVHWLCRCDCGTRRFIRTANLRNGNTKSCGCFQRDRVRIANTRHSDCRTPEYTVWSHMKSRCSNPKHPEWQNYGGRGIAVCQRWFTSYENFFKFSWFYHESFKQKEIENLK